MEPALEPRSAPRAAAWLPPLGLGLLALALRALPAPAVLAGPRVSLPTQDGWYHLRRIRHAIEDFPTIPSSDAFLNHPYGGEAIWSPLFDLVLAAVALPAGPEGFERVAVWVPPLLGTATVLLCGWGVRRAWGRAEAAAAAALLAVLPGHVASSQVGFVDHHVAIGLAALGLLLAGMGWLRALGAGRPLLGPGVVLGCVAGAALALWPGMLLVASLVGLGTWLGLLSASGPARGRTAALSLGLAWAVALPWVAGGWGNEWLAWSRWSPSVASRFQPWLFAAAGLHAAGSAALFVGPLARVVAGRAWLRAGLGALWGGLLLVASAVWIPELRDAVGEAWRWLGRTEAFQASVQESLPLFAGPGGVARAEAQLSRLVYLFPLAWLALAVRGRAADGAESGARRLFLLWSAGLAGATLLQTRFVDASSIALAMVCGVAGVAGWRAGAARLVAAPVGLRAGAAGVAAVLLVWLLLPAAAELPFQLRAARAWVRGEDVPLRAGDRYWRALQETALWLRDHTPAPGPAGAPRYGVLGHWQYGHMLVHVAERPAVVGNFGDDVGGDNLARSFEYLRADEARAVEIARELRVRYVVLRALDEGRGSHGEASMVHRMGEGDGRGLAHHRLIFERPVLRARAESTASHFRVWERVAGAEIVGDAAPGAEVVATLPLATVAGNELEALAATRADAAGRYRLRVPYATGAGRAVRTGSAWRVVADGREGRVEVGERQVRSGARVAGPDLRGLSPAAAPRS